MKRFRKIKYYSFRCIPFLYLVILFALTGYTFYDYSWRDSSGIVRAGKSDLCGDYEPVQGQLHLGTKDYLTLLIKDKENGQLIMSGELTLKAETYEKLLLAKKRVFLSLEGLSSPSIVPQIPYSLDLDMTDVTRGALNQAILKIKDRTMYTGGRLNNFPRDRYQIGFRPVLRFAKADAISQPFPLDAALTNIDLANSLIVKKAATWGDFASAKAVEGEEKTTLYKSDECALNIERPAWYQAMVYLLLALLFVPAIYMLYRPQDNPSVDLIAVILGIAAIRQFLVGNVVDWTLYQIDFVFVGVTVLTAAVPLIHIIKGAKERTWGD